MRKPILTCKVQRKVTMSNFNICRSNMALIIVIVATSLAEDSSPICTSHMNPNGFVGPNTCNVEQETMTFSCAVSFGGISPILMWPTLNGNEALKGSICESKDNRINCSLSMKAEPSFDGFTFICQTTSNEARHNCSMEDIRVEYFFADYEAAEKTMDDRVTCVVERNLQVHYNWRIQQNNQDNIFRANLAIYLQRPWFYKYGRDVTGCVPIITVIVIVYKMFNDEDEETSTESCNVSSRGQRCVMADLLIAVSNAVSKCLVSATEVMAHVISTKCLNDFKRPCYALKNCPRGYCIIVNNFEFTGLEPRSGAAAEIEALKKLFKGLKFKVDPRENLTRQQMVNCLLEYRDRDHSESDAFVCCLLSHGEKGRINATDGQLSVVKLMELFYDGNCPGLEGKPKLFFVGACQGKGDDEKYERMQPSSAQPKPPDINSSTDSDRPFLPEAKKASDELVSIAEILDFQCRDRADIMRELVPSNTDFIVSYACLPGTVAWHDSKHGGLYVQALCKHLNQDLEIDFALRNVSQEVRDLLNTYDKDGNNYSRQDPFHIIMPPHKLLYLGRLEHNPRIILHTEMPIHRQAAFS